VKGHAGVPRNERADHLGEITAEQRAWPQDVASNSRLQICTTRRRLHGIKIRDTTVQEKNCHPRPTRAVWTVHKMPLPTSPPSPWCWKARPMFWTMSRVEGWSFPRVFSLSSRARWYHPSALPYFPRLWNTEFMLSTVSRVEGWSFPSVVL
jgi:hypothetical protein